jgi:RHS repeat-associated protein
VGEVGQRGLRFGSWQRRAWVVYDPNGNVRTGGSAYDIRYFFTGQQWYSELGLYDLRHRFYSSDIGRFLQPDPTGFGGDPTNLYRYCGNNPLNFADPFGDDAIITQPSPNVINIKMFFTFTGFTPQQEATFLSAPQYYFPNQFGPYYVIFTAGRPGLFSPINNVYRTDGTSSMSGNKIWWSPSDGTMGAMHEMMHGAGAPHIGNVATDIMSGPDVRPLQNSVPSVQDIQNILAAGGKGVTANLPSAESTVWGHLSSGAPFVSFIQEPGFSGPIFSGLGEYLGGYGGYFDSAGVFNGVLPGVGASGDFFYGALGGLFANMQSRYANAQAQAFLNISIGVGALVMEPGNGCFVAGTPVLMADRSEKNIESIKPGDTVLAWEDETTQTFTTKVVNALHHEEKMQILFDVELENGRTFTVNNNHPMYVVEDDEFILTRELAARFARGAPITFQDENNQPVKIARLQMRRQACPVYNLQVEGQGRDGHTYYACGVLVHNMGRAARK